MNAMGLASGGYNGRHMTKPFYKILSKARRNMLKNNIDFGYISKNNDGFRSQLYQFESYLSILKRRFIGSGKSKYFGDFTISKKDEDFEINVRLNEDLDEESRYQFEKSLESILLDKVNLSIE